MIHRIHVQLPPDEDEESDRWRKAQSVASMFEKGEISPPIPTGVRVCNSTLVRRTRLSGANKTQRTEIQNTSTSFFNPKLYGSYVV
jgi:hypothetical protein